MMPETSLDPCFILHTRKYRDTSLLVEVFSREQGRYTLVARGARSKKPKFQLQLFSPVLISVFGRGELKTARTIEANGPGFQLSGTNLLIGMYVNELLYRLVGKFDPCPLVFERYPELLQGLQGEVLPLAQLRQFEIDLLSDLGYGISFDVESETGDAIKPDRRYHFIVEDGFHYLSADQPSHNAIVGQDLLSIAAGSIDSSTDRVAKRIIRQSVDHLLGGKPLHSRRLFTQ
jgi:DNA repair protein RecO (recombination protein O)